MNRIASALIALTLLAGYSFTKPEHSNRHYHDSARVTVFEDGSWRIPGLHLSGCLTGWICDR